MYSNVTIIGNGPSVYGSGLGSKIDASDLVIRVHEYPAILPEDFGTKYDYGIIPGPWMERALSQITQVPDKGWLIYFLSSQKRNFPHPPAIMDRPTNIFTKEIDKFFSAILSVGMAPTRGISGIYMAAALFKPERIQLVGFDSVLSSKIVQYHPLTGVKYPDKLIGKNRNDRHDFRYERAMVAKIAEKFDVKIVGI